MKIADMTNLWVVNNKAENFKILVVALDRMEAIAKAMEYFSDANMASVGADLELSSYINTDEHFDCDYVIY